MIVPSADSKVSNNFEKIPAVNCSIAQIAALNAFPKRFLNIFKINSPAFKSAALKAQLSKSVIVPLLFSAAFSLNNPSGSFFFISPINFLNFLFTCFIKPTFISFKDALTTPATSFFINASSACISIIVLVRGSIQESPAFSSP